jgi:hypothetical protein
LKPPLDRSGGGERGGIKEEAETPKPEGTKLGGDYAHLVTGDWVLAEHGKPPYGFYGGKELDGSAKVCS